ncbi:hypothetical protein VB712_18890 [Spirulina sp. CCNP1310]|nr:hypothetical protein [Spirulina sp. CCNP1310]
MMGAGVWLGQVWRSHISLHATIALPSIPSQLDAIVEKVAGLVESFGQPFEGNEREELAASLQPLITQAFATGPRAMLRIEIHPPSPPALGVTCGFTTTVEPLLYPDWGEERRVLMVDAVQGLRGGSRIVEVGAGDGEGAIALRSQGYTVETWEWRGDGGVDINHRQNFLDPLARLDPAAFEGAIALDLALTSLRDPQTLRLLLAKLCDGVVSGGQIYLGLGFTSEELAPELREWWQWLGLLVVTETDLAAATRGLPLATMTITPIPAGTRFFALPEAIAPSVVYSAVAWRRC